MFLAVNVGGLQGTTRLPGFEEVNGFLDFQLAAAITQSILLGGVTAGIATALEIEGGFFDRLVSSPVPRRALLAGRLIATGVAGLVQVLLVPGARPDLRRADRGRRARRARRRRHRHDRRRRLRRLGMLLAFRAKNASTVQGIFPLVFVVLFVSSAFFPRDLLSRPPTGWPTTTR
jgi:ABC-2 type transport system permease protein